MLTLVKTKAKNTKTTFDASGLLWIYIFFPFVWKVTFFIKNINGYIENFGEKDILKTSSKIRQRRHLINCVYVNSWSLTVI